MFQQTTADTFLPHLVNQPSDVIRAITTRCRAICDGINPVIARLAENRILQSKLKNRVARKVKAHKQRKQPELTVEQLVNRINGVRQSGVSSLDLNKK